MLVATPVVVTRKYGGRLSVKIKMYVSPNGSKLLTDENINVAPSAPIRNRRISNIIIRKTTVETQQYNFSCRST